ncbi:MAG: YggT family protein [Alphaproteobacteria bacterium]
MLLAFQLLDATLRLAQLAVIVWVISGWIIALNLGGNFVRTYLPRVAFILGRVIEPVLSPVRRVLPAIGGLDFSPLILLIVLSVMRVFLRDLILALI